MQTIVGKQKLNIIWTGEEGEYLTNSPFERPGTSSYDISFFDFEGELRYRHSVFGAPYKLSEHMLFAKPQLDWVEPEVEHFRKDMDYLHQCFEQGLAKKAVPVCFSKSKKKLRSEEMNYLEKQWFANSDNTYPVFVDTKDFKYLGLSPEILFERKGKLVRTMALAGTRKIDSRFSEKEFLTNPKDLTEHKIVVDSILEDLENYGEVKAGKTYVHKLKSLAHLRTDITLKLEGELSSHELISHMHPTPALGVYPRGSLSDWFRLHNDTQKRSLFGAPILIENQQWSRCIVGIRCSFFEEETWKLGSGCGVVSESNWESEWLELSAKRRSVLEKLGLD